MIEESRTGQDGVGARKSPEIGKVARKRWLSNSVSKKGPMVLAWSIGMPNERCPFASAICGKYCYAIGGQFTLHKDRYAENYELTKRPEFVETISTEIVQFVEQHTDKQVAVAVHEKGELYSLDYLGKWGEIIATTKDLTNLNYFIYTRSWRSPLFLEALNRLADSHGKVQINLSTDSDMIARYGVPKKIGDGLITYLAETDCDIPPPGTDLVFRNLRIRHDDPMEYLGGALVCPYESGLYISLNGDGSPSLANGKCKPIRCQECRLCINRSIPTWQAIKHRYAGTPGQPPNILQFPVQPGQERVA
jgi:hypothetical protein